MSEDIQFILTSLLSELDWLIKTYWIVPVGLIALFYYGRFHFNTPEYALSTTHREGTLSLVRDMPMAKLRMLAPPMFTTSRSRYRRYALRYILILQVAFLAITCLPDIVAYASGLFNPQLQLDLSESVQNRGIWALFGLTGLLSSFPIFKDIDAWLLSRLHREAVIPDSVEQTAEALYDSEFSPKQDTHNDVVRSLRTQHARFVAGGEERGELEEVWLKVRCLHVEIRRLIAGPKYTAVLRKLRSDLDELKETIQHLRERLFEYLSEQDRVLLSNVGDIDAYLEDHQDDELLKQLGAKRRRLVSEVRALFFRMCRLSTILVFATEPRPESMNQVLNRVGFRIAITPVPPWDWDAIFKIGIATLAAILIPSLAYGALAQRIQVPPDLVLYVPLTPKQALAWGLMGASLHVIAVIIALSIKRLYARRRAEGNEFHRPENLIIGAACYVIIIGVQLMLVLLYGGPPSSVFLWSLLPTITGYFVGKYVDKLSSGKPHSNLRAAKQAIIMLATGIGICLIYLLPTFNVLETPILVWYFTLYAGSTAGCIGFAVGYFFQRLYRHREAIAGVRMTPELARVRGQRIIGDLILERIEPPAAQPGLAVV